jgi:4,5-dihydroxyphthalate decarboxylase
MAGHPKVARLFPDYRAAEQAYFARSGIFPIMHLLGIRKELAGSAELCRDICDTFERAKWAAVAELCNTQALSVILPWADIFVQDVRAVMGEDYWPFGLVANRKPLEAILRWLKDQALIDAAPPLASLFAEAARDWAPDKSLRNQEGMHHG